MSMQSHDQVLVALRRIIRAVDLYSRRLAQCSGLTGPQLLVMQAIAHRDQPTSGEVARAVSLSRATVTTILDRLVRNGHVQRRKGEADKRTVLLELTESGRVVLADAPTLIQESFIERFDSLQDWEQHLIISSLQRVAHMMSADDLDAAPLLTTDEPSEEAAGVAECRGKARLSIRKAGKRRAVS
jgi:DNA-binding MarR family transcriptional regulator